MRKKSKQFFFMIKIPRKGSQRICRSVILISSVYRTWKNYYLQVLLEECKYVVKEKKISGNIENLLMKKILIKKIPIKKSKGQLKTKQLLYNAKE